MKGKRQRRANRANSEWRVREPLRRYSLLATGNLLPKGGRSDADER